MFVFEIFNPNPLTIYETGFVTVTYRPFLSAIRNDFDIDLSTSRPIEFTEKDPLPCSEDQPPSLDEDSLGTTDEAGFDVSRRIPLCMLIPILGGDYLI